MTRERYSGSKNHHFFPKGILRGFCFEGDSTFLFDGSQPEKGVCQKNIERVHRKFHANSYKTVEGKRNDFTEFWLSKEVDDKIAKVVQRLRVPYDGRISEDDREVLVRYMLTSVTRNPSQTDAMFKLLSVEGLVDGAMTEIGVDEATIQSKWGDVAPPENVIEYLKATWALDLPEDIVKRVLNFGLFLCRPSNDMHQFVLGDFPIMRYDNLSTQTQQKCSEIWSVLAPDLAVSFVEFPDGNDVAEFDVLLPPAHVKKINYDFAQRSKHVISHCPVLLSRTQKGIGRFPNERSLIPAPIEKFQG